MDLDLPIRTIGRATRDVQAEIVRELNPADLALLSLERGIKPTQIQKLRGSHHALAQCLAGGQSNEQASLSTGYTPSRISVLKSDPAFQELIAHYQTLKGDAFVEVQERLALLNIDAIEEIHERLLEAPEKIDVETLLDIVKVASDRTGNGPSSKSTNVNVNLDISERIRKGRERVLQHVNGGGQSLLTAPSVDRGGEKSPPAPSVDADVLPVTDAKADGLD